MKKLILIIAVLLALVISFKVCENLGIQALYDKWGSEGQLIEELPESEDYNKIRLSHFGVGAGDRIDMLPDLGAHWVRLPFDIDSLGSDPDRVSWSFIDARVIEANKYNVILYGSFNRGGRSTKQIWPKAEIFASYFKKAVERYDGDGIDDMPGLKYPIKNWEILNEVPSLPNQDATPEVYADYLKESYNALKEACPDCKLANGGIPGPIAQEFLEDTIDYDPNVKNYFDILSWHTYSAPFKEKRLNFLEGWEEKMGLNKKEIWYPELGIYTDISEEQRAKDLVKSYAYRFAQGMKVGIYVEVVPHGRGISGGGLIDSSGNKLPIYNTYKILTSKIDYFTDVETLKEEWQETNGFEELKTGHYKFTVNNNPVYVLWGGSLPAEIKGQVKVTYIDGEERITNASEIELNDNPLFIEV